MTCSRNQKIDANAARENFQLGLENSGRVAGVMFNYLRGYRTARIRIMFDIPSADISLDRFYLMNLDGDWQADLRSEGRKMKSRIESGVFNGQ